MLRWFSLACGLALAFAQMSCTATCLRDSDCMGASVCAENRCLLIVGRRGDAGSAPATSTDNDNSGDDTSDAGSDLEADAGSVN